MLLHPTYIEHKPTLTWQQLETTVYYGDFYAQIENKRRELKLSNQDINVEMVQAGSFANWLEEKLNISSNVEVTKEFTKRDLKITDTDKTTIRILPYTHRHYPHSLRMIAGAPAWLYVLGEMPEYLNYQSSVCIVGSRQPSAYGKQVTQDLITALRTKQPCIVSGMAQGIDAQAHQSALDLGLKTIAVLGCGVDVCYPKCNQRLYEQLINYGTILSEFPPKSTPQKQHFPCRNRLLSGLAEHVVVTEAKAKSGTLITAGYAFEQAKELWAVPSSIYSHYSRGCHELLRDCAKPLYCFQDIKDALPEPTTYTDANWHLLHFIAETLPDQNSLLDFLHISLAEFMEVMADLEMSGLVERRLDYWQATEKGLFCLRRVNLL